MEKRKQSTLLAFVNKKAKSDDRPNEEGERPDSVELTNDGNNVVAAVGQVVPSFSNDSQNDSTPDVMDSAIENVANDDSVDHVENHRPKIWTPNQWTDFKEKNEWLTCRHGNLGKFGRIYNPVLASGYRWN